MPVINSIAARKEEMTAWRRDLHAHPELGFEEVRTSAIVAEKLASWGIEVHRGLAKTGVVGVLKGRTDGGRTIGLRADMDCLPMQEVNDFAHKSTAPGRMHACGHDGHTTMLLGAAQYLAETRNFDGTVHFIFQPAEEGGGGGDVMVREGLFDRFPCDEVYGLHNWPLLPAGTVGVRPGPMMAAADMFDIRIHGVGGHAAIPQTAKDPVVIAAQLVGALQTLVSRNTNPMDAAVLSITQIHTGSTHNVIPDEAYLNGTVRTFRPEVQAMMVAGIRRIVDGIAAAFDVVIDIDYQYGYPATVNHAEQAETAARVAETVVGEGNVQRDVEPSLGGEDFAYLLNARPGAYLFLGQAGGASGAMIHNPHYDFNDEVLPLGASLLAGLVETQLKAG
ncbi:M20 aminoacylase family protein [Inquilinus sp. CA228]|uniref:M20 aminoacylase family protein n=1 Tax=Inquilinus sp. CA228 TaxID=3455609 RepID=UPI003F8D41F2